MNVEELNPFDPVEEELVAYLDGELDAAARQQVEQRLASDAAYREKLRRTRESYNALDLLPKTSVDRNFANSTIEMTVALLARETAGPLHKRILEHWLPTLKIAGVALLAFFIGFRLVKNRQLEDRSRYLRDIPVVERLDQLEDVQDLEFLDLLRKENLFAGPSHESL